MSFLWSFSPPWGTKISSAKQFLWSGAFVCHQSSPLLVISLWLRRFFIRHKNMGTLFMVDVFSCVSFWMVVYFVLLLFFFFWKLFYLVGMMKSWKKETTAYFPRPPKSSLKSTTLPKKIEVKMGPQFQPQWVISFHFFIMLFAPVGPSSIVLEGWVWFFFF